MNHSIASFVVLLLICSSWLVGIDAAVCSTTINGNTYDLSRLTKIGTSIDYSASSSNGDKFFINFCAKVTTPGMCPSITSAVCGNFSTGQGSAGALSAQSWAKLPTGTGVALTYGQGSLCPGSTTQKRTTTINVVCNRNADPGTFGQVTEGSNCQYTVEFQSVYGCPTSSPPPPPPPGPPGPPGPPPPPPPPPDCSGSSSGSGCEEGGGKGIYFIIAVIVVTVVYFGGGSAIRKFAMHKEGSDIIPQVDFWKDLPFLVKDGIVYSVSKIFAKIRGGEHEPLLH